LPGGFDFERLQIPRDPIPFVLALQQKKFAVRTCAESAVEVEPSSNLPVA
jgi:hypothetical protein